MRRSQVRSRRLSTGGGGGKAKRPMMGSVHPASPSHIHNEVRMIEPHANRARRQASFKARHGYGIV